MHLYTKVNNLFVLLTLDTTKLTDPKWAFESLLRLKKFYKSKYSLTRFLICKRLKALRKTSCKFIPIDYSEAKQMYYDYFNMDNHIDYNALLTRLHSGEEIYLLQFRREYPVKDQNKYETYYIYYNGCKGKSLFKLDKNNLSELENYTNLRYATYDEIKLYLSAIEKEKIIRAEIKVKEDELSALHTSLHNLWQTYH